MSIIQLIDDATSGVIYNQDWGITNKLYRSTDYGFTWEPIDDLTSGSDEYWTFKNAPGVLLKRNMNPVEMRISYDYGSHFETLDIPAFYMNNEAGWNVGEFFKEDFSECGMNTQKSKTCKNVLNTAFDVGGIRRIRKSAFVARSNAGA